MRKYCPFEAKSVFLLNDMKFCFDSKVSKAAHDTRNLWRKLGGLFWTLRTHCELFQVSEKFSIPCTVGRTHVQVYKTTLSVLFFIPGHSVWAIVTFTAVQLIDREELEEYLLSVWSREVVCVCVC